MSAVTIAQMADRVAGLMEERLGVRGQGLSAKLRRGGGKLPRKVRDAAEALAVAAAKAQNPKLLVQVDEGDVALLYDICVRHLSPINAGARRKGMLMSFAASVAFSVLTVAVLTVAFLVWRGYL